MRPSGTTRSFAPLPNARSNPPSRSMSLSDRPTSSEIRSPVPYSTSRMARSRRSVGSSPTTAPSRRSTSSSDNAFGSPRGTRGNSTSAAGSFVTSCSSALKRCNARTATMARATDEGALARLAQVGDVRRDGGLPDVVDREALLEQPAVVGAQIPAVCRERVRRSTPLDREPRQELLDVQWERDIDRSVGVRHRRLQPSAYPDDATRATTRWSSSRR